MFLREHGELVQDCSASDIVNEYWQRRALAKLGFTFDGSTLTARHAERLLQVEYEINRRRAAKTKAIGNG